NKRFVFPAWRPALGAAMVATVALLVAVIRIGAEPSGSTEAPGVVSAVNAPVTFAEVRHIIDRRCGACHSAHPSDMTFGGVAPLGVMFDTPEEIIARASRIKERAVVQKTMPLGNKTN